MTIPVFILKEGTSERTEEEVRQHVLVAAQVINETLKSILGPHGKYKLIMDTFGDVTITSSGATVLDEVDIEHPVAKILVEVAKAMNKEIGDGITRSIILATELIKRGIELQRKGIHASIIVEGYMEAYRKSIEVLESIAKPFDIRDRKTLFRISRTTVTGSLSKKDRDVIAEIAVEAALRTVEGNKLDLDRIKLDKKGGEVVFETMLVEGIALDKELVHAAMPKSISNPKIALIDLSLELKKTEYDSKLKFKDPVILKKFIEQEQATLNEMVNKIKNSGANVVLCQKGIDDLVQYLLAKQGISAVRRIKKSDMEKLSLATGAKIITNLDELDESALGKAKLMEEKKIGDEKWVFIHVGEESKTVNIIFRGANDKIVSEAERMTKKALNALRLAFLDPRIVPGAGAAEAELARKLREEAKLKPGKTSFALEAFSSSMEVIPSTLAMNAGKDPGGIMSMLIAAHADGKRSVGTGEIEKDTIDSLSMGIVEPIALMKAILSSAIESAMSLLRIDRITAIAKFKPPPGKGPEEGQY